VPVLAAPSTASADNQPDNQSQYDYNSYNSQHKPNRDVPESGTAGNYIATALLPGNGEYNLVIPEIMFIRQSVNILTYTTRQDVGPRVSAVKLYNRFDMAEYIFNFNRTKRLDVDIAHIIQSSHDGKFPGSYKADGRAVLLYVQLSKLEFLSKVTGHSY
jgi:hypothetical protein